MSSRSGTNNNHTSNGNRTWNSTTGSSAVLPEQTNTRNTNTFVKQRNDVICHRCGVAGHISPNCPLKRDDNNWSRSDSGRLARNESASHSTSPKHPVSHSSTESELKALDEAIRECLWMRGFLHEIGFTQSNPSTL